MRKITLGDYFRFCDMIRAIGGIEFLREVNARANAAVANARPGESVSDSVLEEVGMQVIWMILDNTSKPESREAINRFLAPIMGVSSRRMQRMSLEKIAQRLQALLQDGSFSLFFDLARKTGQEF